MRREPVRDLEQTPALTRQTHCPKTFVVGCAVPVVGQFGLVSQAVFLRKRHIIKCDLCQGLKRLNFAASFSSHQKVIFLSQRGFPEGGNRERRRRAGFPSFGKTTIY